MGELLVQLPSGVIRAQRRGLSLQREVARDKNLCFLQKIAGGESPGHTALKKPLPASQSKGYFLGSSDPIHEDRQLFRE